MFQHHIIFGMENMDVGDAVPTWIMSAYTFLVSGPLAAQIAQTQPSPYDMHIIIAGLSGQGLGWMLALLMYSVRFSRLIRLDMPSPSVRPGMYVSLGLAAYTCAGLLALGNQGKEKVPQGYMGITSLDFSGLTTLSALRKARYMRFSLQWWAFVVSNAGLAIATN
ncbi:voltage-dependent anion channel [Pseudomassariella vexata]|uniref:Voltage-dependent anion channel n=1 Tax=Pseudomassariella vexata TaxID=1141098 RepID=A0A1Y2DYH9_9PEZI|nr:voltage-dependent anion channel [Pseudomassariella vexata]ORY64166.1 voltage-dependent anion channel [Pseudomassariella vexata]